MNFYLHEAFGLRRQSAFGVRWRGLELWWRFFSLTDYLMFRYCLMLEKRGNPRAADIFIKYLFRTINWRLSH